MEHHSAIPRIEAERERYGRLGAERLPARDRAVDVVDAIRERGQDTVVARPLVRLRCRTDTSECLVRRAEQHARLDGRVDRESDLRRHAEAVPR